MSYTRQLRRKSLNSLNKSRGYGRFMLGKSKADIGASANIIWKCTGSKSIHKDNVKACFLCKESAQPFFSRE